MTLTASHLNLPSTYLFLTIGSFPRRGLLLSVLASRVGWPGLVWPLETCPHSEVEAGDELLHSIILLWESENRSPDYQQGSGTYPRRVGVGLANACYLSGKLIWFYPHAVAPQLLPGQCSLPLCPLLRSPFPVPWKFNVLMRSWKSLSSTGPPNVWKLHVSINGSFDWCYSFQRQIQSGFHKLFYFSISLSIPEPCLQQVWNADGRHQCFRSQSCPQEPAPPQRFPATEEEMNL